MATSVNSRASIAALVAFVTAATFALPRAASADEPDDAPATERQWYGGPMVAVDVASFGLLIAADALGDSDASGALAVVGVTGFALFAPIDHAARGHGKRTWGSLALRVGLPLAGVLAAAVTCKSNGSGSNCDDSVGTGAIFGAFTAVVLDDILLAYDEPPVARATSGLQLGLAPRGEGGFTASVGATF
jgi:hypothetical protein